MEISDLTLTAAHLASRGILLDEVREVVRAHRPGSSERFLAERGITLPADFEDVGLKQRVFDPLQEEFP